MICRVCKWVEKEGNLLTTKGLIRINPKKPSYGSMMLVAEVPFLNGGFMNMKKKIGFIVGEVNTLTDIILDFELEEGDDFSDKVSPQRIVTIELLASETPENKGFREKINPSTDELLLKNGEQIMWKTQVVDAGSDVKDSYIEHNSAIPMGNGERILSNDDMHFVGAVDVDISIRKR